LFSVDLRIDHRHSRRIHSDTHITLHPTPLARIDRHARLRTAARDALKAAKSQYAIVSEGGKVNIISSG
jgi:hypothetical protein